MKLSEETITQLKKINQDISIPEVIEVYLPLSRLISFYISLQRQSQNVSEDNFDIHKQTIPYVISITGSVASGKSTMARIFQILLNGYLKYKYVELISTDGFLYPNSVLNDRGLITKKGFPLSYDVYRLVQFVLDLKSDFSPIIAPLYSHLISDVIPSKKQIVQKPDILILEGLNVLQRGMNNEHISHMVSVSDFIDFSIYIDASHDLLQSWYISRFLRLRQRSFTNQQSYFYYYSQLSTLESMEIARKIWYTVNYRNLIDNILPTRKYATLVITKSVNHFVQSFQMKRNELNNKN
ncbi:type I pantothenate kinase [Candidatus Erwinia haradaeae]|uniref:Pantothenate kinase n=1 Tax=Candidatus Erwinia haradaeae TaxID=1922217 RepID=A0A803GCJ6_9GAMM|nr:type I pantothenate kinase [Candidatus Erwinia haradaeae]VFP88163.1 Pantothenate kinase [Candidatus Erwinia haradaeae]